MKAFTKKSLNSVGVLAGVGALAMGLMGSPMAQAQEKYLGEVILVGFNFCPRGTYPAEGALLSISQNTALFSLFGTQYGGDGRNTFGLPDLRGRAAINEGQGPGLPRYLIGSKGGSETVVLTANQMPAHSHAANATTTVKAKDGAGNSSNPTGRSLAVKNRTNIYSDAAPDVDMNSDAVETTVTVGNTGGSQPFSVRDPYLTMRYCVVSQGVYPSRN